MKADGMMIGNYVYAHGGSDDTFCGKEQPVYLAKVSGISDDGVFLYTCIDKMPDYYHKSIKHIPLTEEWLIKLGGEKDESGDAYVSVNRERNLRLYLKNGHALLCKGDCCPMFEYEHIDKVHLFQNLFNALTGEELTA